MCSLAEILYYIIIVNACHTGFAVFFCVSSPVLATSVHVCAPQIIARQRIHLAGRLNLVHSKLYIRREDLNK